jgi:hypothetical protein
LEVYADEFEMAMTSSMRMRAGSNGDMIVVNERYQPELEL